MDLELPSTPWMEAVDCSERELKPCVCVFLKTGCDPMSSYDEANDASTLSVPDRVL